MPSKTDKQRRFMRAAAKNPKFARKAGIPQRVAKDFYAADRRVGYWTGGGVLGRLLNRVMRPERDGFRVPKPPDAAPAIRSADRALARADKLRMRFGRS